MAAYALYLEPVAGEPGVYRYTMVFAQADDGSVAVRAIDGHTEAAWQTRLTVGELCYFDGASWSLRCVPTSDPGFFRVLRLVRRHGRAHLAPPQPCANAEAETICAEVFKQQIVPAHTFRLED